MGEGEVGGGKVSHSSFGRQPQLQPAASTPQSLMEVGWGRGQADCRIPRDVLRLFQKATECRRESSGMGAYEKYSPSPMVLCPVVSGPCPTHSKLGH